MKENQTQPKSFRITEETANKLKEIAALTGKNQQETLAMLIQVYEFQEGKEILPGKRDDIEQFEGMIGAITRMYMSALEEGKDAMTVAKSKYEAQLKAKDEIILELQQRNKDLAESQRSMLSEKEAEALHLQAVEAKNIELENAQNFQKESYEALLRGKEEVLSEKMH